MNQSQRLSLLLVRLALGWLFLYSGVIKVMNPEWSAAGYIAGAKNFVGFYQTLLNPEVLPFINILNAWGMLLIGLSLILGLYVRASASAAALMMILFYLVLPFPKQNAASYIVDQHIVYALVLIYLAVSNAGTVYGLDKRR